MNTEKGYSMKDVWAGLIGVKPKPGSDFFDEGIKGAYVNILAWAKNAIEYHAEIERALTYYGLDLKNAENIEPFSKWLSRNETIDNNLVELAEEVRKTGKVRFGTFHEYEDENNG